MKNQNFLSKPVPVNDEPQLFLPQLTPKNKLIHKGILSPDNQSYYYTESNKDFSNFNVKTIQKERNGWSKSKNAFFNTEYDEHGMSFSPDGKYLYFSSTRPTNIEGIPNTWHIWRSKKVNDNWTNPEFINIPNMQNKLVFHPSISNAGKMFFHASNLDYSEMNIYSSVEENGKYTNPVLVDFGEEGKHPKCTPFISPDERYLIYAEIQEDLVLKISFKTSENTWSKPKTLSKKINTAGLGNPFVSKDEAFLFFTRKGVSIQGVSEPWNVYWVKMQEGVLD